MLQVYVNIVFNRCSSNHIIRDNNNINLRQTSDKKIKVYIEASCLLMMTNDNLS
ncbi:hypothetical protein CDL12_05335 [Handroanthus impetiginosus]|uniref:Uncharacterized protein n=1 Tax=Handroanthus impetiginosus TaxID=429701 RepID=A0A2G9HWR6_9LAMI|nr:hypothetical protein CDL12_05335 [Handroanthus impetiginosus]